MVAFAPRGTAWADEGSSLGPDRHARDVESLDRYALERWEVILHFMVGSPSAAVSQDLAQLLIQAGLMRRYRPPPGSLRDGALTSILTGPGLLIRNPSLPPSLTARPEKPHASPRRGFSSCSWILRPSCGTSPCST